MQSVPVVAVDTNVFLRYFLDDDREQTERAEALLLGAAAGRIRLLVFPVVVAEIVWTLQKYFRQPRSRIRKVIEALLAMRNVAVAERGAIERAIGWYAESNADWTDAYIAAAAAEAGHPEVLSFDRGAARRFEGVTWREP